MDDWTRQPGAQVQGHRAVARAHDGGPWQVACTCGYRSQEHAATVDACVALVEHLQQAVRRGAPVLPGSGPGGDGEASGVREPRRPRPPVLPGTATAVVEHAAPPTCGEGPL